ncbi:undecaprenyldiphospho-muramoylpentapeptide beta-N-acetylglucosaminyltransferase [Aquilutibacter rugosus]|uniref:undecaprenyldiphospho-muramoylpentapeptide beta-N-acetylglucosaminyltransferase n=1 Tax=Aquilutibacter rugosus TaxID=3115820 RepID=UPI002F3E2A72
MRLRNPNGPVIILAGGTGGHIFPGLAVAKSLQERGVEVRWLGAEGGMETRLVPQHQISMDTLQIKGLRGKGIRTLLTAPLKVLRAIGAARAVLKQRRPRAVISFGGYAAGPGGIAARLSGVPLFVHEQNRAAGMTNRVLSRMADAVLTGFPDTFNGVEERWVGNPVRGEIAAIAEPSVRFAERAEQTALNILVLGGSQGAKVLNDAVPVALRRLNDEGHTFSVRHQCGERGVDGARHAYAAAGIEATIEPFIADMSEAYAWADLVICRAGALTLAEVCAVGVGSVLVPFAAAVDDHQTKNAQYLVARHAARIASQSNDLADKLVAHVREIGNRDTLLVMATAARELAKPHAADEVAQVVMEEAA